MSERSLRCIHGVDFSGAQNAGEKIWISSGEIESERLVIYKCRSAADEFGARDRETVFERLREFVADRKRSVFGFDFPFGLPETVTDTTEWDEFVRTFSNDFDGPDHLRETCVERAGGQKSRATEVETAALCPYDVRIKYQTFYGICGILNPLLRNRAASVLPMMEAETDLPWLLEVYPAATLEQLGLERNGYKKQTVESRKRRTENADGLIKEGVDIDDEARANAVCNDDALDSLVAAFATFRAVRDGPPAIDKASHPEGHIYV